MNISKSLILILEKFLIYMQKIKINDKKENVKAFIFLNPFIVE
jgi:hypothetical protein